MLRRSPFRRFEAALPARPFAYGLCMLTALCWAGTIIAGRIAAPDMPPMAVNFWRWVVAFAVMAPFTGAALYAKRRVIAANLRILLTLGGLNMTAFGGLFFLGLEHSQAINGSILLATMTINIVLVSWLLVGVRISAVQALGVAVGFLGIVIIAARGDPEALVGLSFGVGDPLIWASTLAYAVYSTTLRKAPGELAPVELMTVLCLVGVLACLPMAAAEAWLFARPTSWSLDALLAVGFLGLFPSALAQILWVAGIKRIGATTAGYFIYTVPVFGTAMAIGVLGETLYWYHLVGIALVFVGVYAAAARAGRRDQTGRGSPPPVADASTASSTSTACTISPAVTGKAGPPDAAAAKASRPSRIERRPG